MNRVAPLAFAALCALDAAVSVRGEEAPKSPPAPPEKPARAISPHMAEVLRATAPRYEDVVRPPTASPAGPVKTALPLETDAGVASLPRYIVNEGKLPTPAEVMSRRAVEEAAMNRYLGPKDGFDRGFLNAVTIKELWRKIPMLGRIPCPIPSVTNAERAMARYNEDLRLEKMNDLLELSAMTTKSGDRAQGDRIKRETQSAFKWE